MDSHPTPDSPPLIRRAATILPNAPPPPPPNGDDPSSPGFDSLARGDVIRNRYRILQEIGRGGMSRVYVAADQLREEARDPHPEVAIKLLTSEISRLPEALQIVQREASKSQHLAHPNIASVYEFDRYNGLLYLVMEYLEGRDLRSHIKEHGNGMPLRSAASIIRGMAAGLSYAHSREVTHHDFKPSNVFVLPDGGIKIFDFGIARHAGRKEAELILAAGTPAYMSPEAYDPTLAHGEHSDVLADVFSFAVTVYELLAGKHPFDNKTQEAIKLELVPKSIDGLSRRQWKALRAGLELLPEKRAVSVMAVAAPFLREPERSPIKMSVLVERAYRWITGLRPTPAAARALEPVMGARTWVADQPVQVPADDQLAYMDYAKALFGVIDHPKITPPLNIAINGTFGIGKSSVALLTQHLLRSKLEDGREKPHVTAWMHLGRYRGTESLRTAFVRDFARELYLRQSVWFRFRHALPSAFLLRAELRRRRLVRAAFLLALGAGAFFVTKGGALGVDPLGFEVSAAVGIGFTSLLGVLLGLTSMFGPLKSLADYVDPQEDGASATQQAEARRQIENLVARLMKGNRRLILFIDDLERSPERTLEVLDIVESLFSLPSCITVMPTDMDVLGQALEQHKHIRNGRRYLEKYVQLQFDMPSVENARLLALLGDDQRDAVREQNAVTRVTLPGDPALGTMTIANARDRIDQHLAKEGVTGPVPNSGLVVPATRWNQLVDERKQRKLPETDIYKVALRTAISLAGRDIRAAKRISNHVRLYVSVLFNRGLLHTASRLTPEHVGRWIAMKELWPEILSTVTRSPDLFAVLTTWAKEPAAEDHVASLNRLAKQLGSLHGGALADLMSPLDAGRVDILRSFLNAKPDLSPVVHQLCFLRASAGDPPPSA